MSHSIVCIIQRQLQHNTSPRPFYSTHFLSKSTSAASYTAFAKHDPGPDPAWCWFSFHSEQCLLFCHAACKNLSNVHDVTLSTVVSVWKFRGQVCWDSGLQTWLPRVLNRGDQRVFEPQGKTVHVGLNGECFCATQQLQFWWSLL